MIKDGVSYCDQCGKPKPNTRWFRIISEDGSASVDLCPRHATPLMEFAALGDHRVEARHRVEAFDVDSWMEAR